VVTLGDIKAELMAQIGMVSSAALCIKPLSIAFYANRFVGNQSTTPVATTTFPVTMTATILERDTMATQNDNSVMLNSIEDTGTLTRAAKCGFSYGRASKVYAVLDSDARTIANYRVDAGTQKPVTITRIIKIAWARNALSAPTRTTRHYHEGVPHSGAFQSCVVCQGGVDTMSL
jgi:hypothetical protein